MDLRQLEYIVKIAEEKSITRAAEKLYITQSALNQQLLKLEGELGTKLFFRGKNECTPTKAGEIYLKGAREILSIRHRTYNEISDLMETRKSHISVGFTQNRGIDMFVHVYPKFHKLHPEIIVDPREMSVRRQMEEISSDRLDIGFMTLADEQKTNANFIKLAEEEFYVILPDNHPLAAAARRQEAADSHQKATASHQKATAGSQSSISSPQNAINSPQKAVSDLHGQGFGPALEIDLKLLKDDPFVLLYKESTSRVMIDHLFAAESVVPKVLFDTSSNNAIVHMVQTGQCCGVVPGFYLRNHPQGICPFTFRNHLTWEVVVCYKKGGYLSKPASDFINMAKEYWGYV